MSDASRPPLPPFTAETAAQKARLAEDAWNSRDPQRVSMAYTADSAWRNRAEFVQGRDAIVAFLTRKWARELDYRLIKEVWTFGGNRIAVRFAYEWRDDSAQWFRSYGNENWEFSEQGLMQRRVASINDLPIATGQRLFHWPRAGGPTIIPADAARSLVMAGPKAARVRLATPADAAALSLVGSATFLETFAGLHSGADILAHCERNHCGRRVCALARGTARRGMAARGTAGRCPGGLRGPRARRRARARSAAR